MVDKKQAIATMIAQHRTLQQEVAAVAEILKMEVADAELIVQGLQQFSRDLAAHLALENNVFYVELLKEMRESGKNTVDTEAFIAEMKDIEKAVLAFLGKFKDAGSISQQLSDFKDEFAQISQTLALRIETEESGVYTYWYTGL